MTDVIDAVEAATIAVVDMSFKVTTPRLAGHCRYRQETRPGSTLNILSELKIFLHFSLI